MEPANHDLTIYRDRDFSQTFYFKTLGDFMDLTDYTGKAEIRENKDAADLLAAASWGQGSDARGGAVLLVGHQPSLGRLAALLLSGQEADWAIKKGGLWWISQRARENEAQTTLRAVINPDLL